MLYMSSLSEVVYALQKARGSVFVVQFGAISEQFVWLERYVR